MQKHAGRVTLLALLFASAAGASLLVWSAEERARGLASTEREMSDRLGRLAELMAAMTAAQQAYGATRQTGEHWYRHISDLVERIYAETAAVTNRPGAGESSPHLRALAEASGVMVQATSRARDNLSDDRDLMAADLLLEETRETVAGMSANLARVRLSERAAYEAERAGLERRSWTAIGMVTGLWALALVVLGRPTRARVPEPSTSKELIGIEPPESVPEDTSQAPPTIDLKAAAELCTAISRVTSADALPNLLARAAGIIDATGIILWMRGGESLFAISAYGYDRDLLTRVSPLPLNARCLTTAACQTGTVSVAPGDATTIGAIVAPMWDATGCIGALAVEARHALENESALRACVELIAAQLAMAVAASPSPDAGEVQTGDGQYTGHSDLPLTATGA